MSEDDTSKKINGACLHALEGIQKGLGDDPPESELITAFSIMLFWSFEHIVRADPDRVDEEKAELMIWSQIEAITEQFQSIRGSHFLSHLREQAINSQNALELSIGAIKAKAKAKNDNGPAD